MIVEHEFDQGADSIIVYVTSAGAVAQDGTERSLYRPSVEKPENRKFKSWLIL
jgi:hypothetical protein